MCDWGPETDNVSGTAYVGKDYAIDSVRVHVVQQQKQQQEAVTETDTETDTDATRAGPKGINLANLRG